MTGRMKLLFVRVKEEVTAGGTLEEILGRYLITDAEKEEIVKSVNTQKGS